MRGATVFRINVSGGGVPKLPVDEAVVGELGVVGDDHHDKENHGGPLKALCLYSMEALQRLEAEGPHVGPGGVGGNIPLQGLDVADLHPGDQLQLGGVEIQITAYASPCKTIAGNFVDGK